MLRRALAGSDTGIGISREAERLRLTPKHIPKPAVTEAIATAHGKPELAGDVAFLLFHGFDYRTLLLATQRAARIGTSALSVLIADQTLSEADYATILARRLDAPLAATALPDARTDLAQALRQGWCRARLPDGRDVVLLTPSGPLVAALLAMNPAKRRGCFALATKAQFDAILLRQFSATVAHFASNTVEPALSAQTGATRWQVYLTAAALLLFIGGCLMFPELMRTLLPLAFGFFFLGASVVTLSACVESVPVSKIGIEREDARLPRYSILVPLYREADILGDLVSALGSIDYPIEKLQILLVVEENDTETQQAIASLGLPPHMQAFVAPAGAPQTKPRAINAAMPFVTGDLVVVYDAEDRPDPAQLRAAAAAFRKAPPTVVCLQARLAIDNTDDSWLTKLFTIEYAALFDVVKAGNARMGLPVPLGGTSNHFRTEALRDQGLWDAWNVTEDADLGFRLAMHGLHVDDLPSTTEEEAPNRFRPWLHQRRRWLKGWMQTIVCHSRNPVAAMRSMGPVNFFAAVSISAGVVAGALGAPFFHVLVALRVLSGEPWGDGDALHRLADAIIVVLGITGVAAMALPAILGLWRRRLLRLLPWVLFLPIYQVLVSLAAWLALYDLAVAPHAWNKTMHGFAKTSRRNSVQKQ